MATRLLSFPSSLESHPQFTFLQLGTRPHHPIPISAPRLFPSQPKLSTHTSRRRNPSPLPRNRPPLVAFTAWMNASLEAQDLQEFTSWLKQLDFPDQAVHLRRIEDGGVGGVVARDLQAGEIAIRVPEKYTVTCVDVANHPIISRVAAGRSDLIGLTFWLMYEKWVGKKSLWYPYIKTFPSTTLSPLTWSTLEQENLLKGTSVLGQAKQRIATLEEEFADIIETFKDDLKELPSQHFNIEAFKCAFSVITSRAVYLPSAELFALVPYGDALNLNGECESFFDYDVDEQAVVLRVDKSYKNGEQIFISYGENRPNSDLMISFGFVDESNSNDFLEVEVGLVDGDPLRMLKRQILQAASLEEFQAFPLYLNRFPTQLLGYMRLARLQDSALIAKISFDKDVIVDQANEYEVLNLLLSECRDKLSKFDGGIDDEIRLLKIKDLSPKEVIAAKLRLCEKRIWSNTMGALRNRLAPIRGIPTKSGSLKDPNSDIKEMFDMVEQVASAPQKFLSNFMKK